MYVCMYVYNYVCVNITSSIVLCYIVPDMMGDTGGDLVYSHMSIGQLRVLLILILFLTCHSFLIAITGMTPLLLTMNYTATVKLLNRIQYKEQHFHDNKINK